MNSSHNHKLAITSNHPQPPLPFSVNSDYIAHLSTSVSWSSHAERSLENSTSAPHIVSRRAMLDFYSPTSNRSCYTSCTDGSDPSASSSRSACGSSAGYSDSSWSSPSSPLPSCDTSASNIQETIRALETSFFDALSSTSDSSLAEFSAKAAQVEQKALRSSPELLLETEKQEIDISSLLRIHAVSSALSGIASGLEALQALPATKSNPPVVNAPCSLLKSIRHFVKQILFTYT